MSSYQKSDIKMVPTFCCLEYRTRVQMKIKSLSFEPKAQNNH